MRKHDFFKKKFGGKTRFVEKCNFTVLAEKYDFAVWAGKHDFASIKT